MTEYAKEGLTSDKLNLSRYYEPLVVYEGYNVLILYEGESVKLFNDNYTMEFYGTSVHNLGCLTMVIGDILHAMPLFQR